MSCRLCKHAYHRKENGKLEVYFKLFCSKSRSITPAERLSRVGIKLDKSDNDNSNTICRPCEASIKCLENAASIREKWGLMESQDDDFHISKRVALRYEDDK